MKKLQPMAVDEQATLKTEASDHEALKRNLDYLGTPMDDRIVKVVFSVKPDGEKGTPRYNLTQRFDFTGVTIAELLILAVRSLRIDVQAIWRKAKDRMDADVWQDRKWSVRAMLDQTRQKADPAQKVLNAASKMSKQERAKLMLILKGMDNNEQ